MAKNEKELDYYGSFLDEEPEDLDPGAVPALGYYDSFDDDLPVDELSVEPLTDGTGYYDSFGDDELPMEPTSGPDIDFPDIKFPSVVKNIATDFGNRFSKELENQYYEGQSSEIPATPQEVATGEGIYQPYEEAYQTSAMPPRELSGRLNDVTFSDSDARHLLITNASNPELSIETKTQFLEAYINDVISESSEPPGYRPKDIDFQKERKRNIRQTAIAAYDSDRRPDETLEEAIESSENRREVEDIEEDIESEMSVWGANMSLGTAAEYARNLLTDELGQSDMDPELKQKAFSILSEKLGDGSTSVMEDITDAFIFDTAAVKNDQNDGLVDVGSLYKVGGGLANLSSGLIGIGLSSIVAPVANRKYYIRGEKPTSPEANFLKLGSAASQMIDQRLSGKGSQQNVSYLLENFLETGSLDANDNLFNWAVEVSLRGRRITDDDGNMSVPAYQASSIIRATNQIADDQNSIKADIGLLLLSDPNRKDLEVGTKEFNREVNRIFSRYSMSGFAENDPSLNDSLGLGSADGGIFNPYNNYNAKYRELFEKYVPESNVSQKQIDLINNAAYVVFEHGPIDDSMKLHYMGDLEKFISIIPDKARRDEARNLLGSVAGSTPFTGSLVSENLRRRELFSNIAIRHVQKEEVRILSEMAANGELGPSWRGDQITKGTKEEIKRKRERLHKYAPHLIVVQQMSKNVLFQDSASSYFNNVGAALGEMPYQAGLSVIAVAGVLGVEIGSEELQKLAREKLEKTPVDVMADVAGITAATAKVARAGGRLSIDVKDAASVALGKKSPGGGITTYDYNPQEVPILQKFSEQYGIAKRKNSHIFKTILEEDIDPANTIYNLQDDPDGVRAEVIEGQVSVSPENTIGQYQRTLNDIDKRLSDENSKPEAERSTETVRELEAQRIQIERLQISRMDHVLGDMNATVTADGSAKIPLVEVVEASQRSNPKTSIETPDRIDFKDLDRKNDARFLAEEMGIPADQIDPLIALTEEVRSATKKHTDRSKDPVTGKMLDAAELYRQIEFEILDGNSPVSKKDLGAEWQRRRYTPEEISRFDELTRTIDYYVKTGIDEADFQVFDGVASGDKVVTEAFQASRAKEMLSDLDVEAFEMLTDLDVDAGSTQVPVKYVANITPPGGWKKRGAHRQEKVVIRVDRENNQILIDEAEVKRTFDRKAWTDPKVEGVNAYPENAFRTLEEWKIFLIEHGRSHFRKDTMELPKGAERKNHANNTAYSAVLEFRNRTGDPRDALPPEAIGSDLSKIESKARQETIRKEVVRELNVLDEFHRMDESAARQDAIYGKNVLDGIASKESYNIRNYTTPKGTKQMISILTEMGIDDIRVWDYLISVTKAKYLKRSKNSIAGGIAAVRNKKIISGEAERAKAVRSIDPEDGPISVFSKETRKSSRVVRDEFESLAIADELSKTVDNPEAYAGLNLPPEVIERFIERGKRSKNEAASVKKTSDYFMGEYDDVVEVDTPNFKGTIAPKAPAGAAPLKKVYGVSQDSMGRRLRRAIVRTMAGQEGVNFMNAYRETGQKRFIFHLAAESLSRPFAITNIPGFTRNLIDEAALHHFSKGSDESNSLLVGFLDKFSKPQKILGAEDHHAIALSEGSTKFETDRLARAFNPKKEMDITQSDVQRVFDDAEASFNNNETMNFSRMELSELGHILGRNFDVEVIDPSTGNKYRVSNFLELTGDAKNFFYKKLEILEDIERNTSSNTPRGKRKLEYIDEEIEKVNAIIDSGDTRVAIKDIFPDVATLKRSIDDLVIKSRDNTKAITPEETLNLERMLDEYEVVTSFEMNDVIRGVSDTKYSVTKPIKMLSDFERAVVVIANDFVNPRRKAVQDIVFQIVAGEDTARLFYNKSDGHQNIVARQSPDGSLSVIEKFDNSESGALKAKAYMESAGPDTGSNIYTFTEGDIASIAYESSRGKGKKPPSRPIKGRAFDVEPYDILRITSDYISTFIETERMVAFLEHQLERLEAGKTNPTAMQGEINRLAENVLLAFPESRALLDASGGNAATAIKLALSLTAKEQVSRLGRELSTIDKFFLRKSFGSVFKPAELLQMYADYQMSAIETVVGLTGTLHTLKLQSYLRSKGKIINQYEYSTLPDNLKKQYIEVDDVKVGDDLVFPSTMSGGFINRQVADYFGRQKALQEAFSKSREGGIQLGYLQQATKANLVLDVFNSSVMRNMYSGMLVQGILQGKVIANPVIIAKTAKALLDIQKGTMPSDKRLLRIIKAHASDTSFYHEMTARKAPLTEGAIKFATFVYELFKKMGDDKIVQKVQRADNPNAKAAIEDLAEALKLKDFRAGNEFLKELNTVDFDAPIQALDNPTEVQRVAKALGIPWKALQFIYSKPDMVQKIAMQYQLETSHNMKPSAAYSEALRTYVSYVDLPKYLDFMRYGTGNQGVGTAASLASSFTMDFITFAAAQVQNHAYAITNNPMRTFVYAHLARANDKALEETLKMKRSIAELRSITGDPTLNFLPGFLEEETVAKDKDGLSSFTGGAMSYRGSVITGTPAPVPLAALGLEGAAGNVPLYLPFDPSVIYQQLPQNIEDIVPEDYANVFKSLLVNGMGAIENQARESLTKPVGHAKLKRRVRDELIESGAMEGEVLDVPDTAGWEGAARVVATRLIPRYIRSFVSIWDGTKRPSQIWGGLAGVTVSPYDPRTLPAYRMYPRSYYKRLNIAFKELVDKKSSGGVINEDDMSSIEQELIGLREQIKRSKYELKSDQLDSVMYIELELLGKVFSGELDIEKVISFQAGYKQMMSK